MSPLCITEVFADLTDPRYEADLLAFVSDTEQTGSGDRCFYFDSNALTMTEAPLWPAPHFLVHG
ncbi:MAG: hypothetical protein ABI353_21275 [Isosphaeraceae bacterium]